MKFVVDNSVVMAWCFDDESAGYPDAVLELMKTSEALVPSIWPLEVSNVLVVAERRKRLNEADSARFLKLLAGLPFRVIPDTPSRVTTEVFALARRHQLSVYDASYLDLAMREGVALATSDKSLRAAASSVRVALLQPSPK